jgi:DNA-binding LacI/PurR family transcriptional regulator
MRVIGARSNMSTDWLEDFRQQLAADPPTAILFGSDDLALPGLKVMSDLRLQIPRDISVISTNDTLAPPVVPVPLSTIQPDYEALGRGAMELLLELLDQPVSAPPPATRLARARFVSRQSTTSPRRKIV